MTSPMTLFHIDLNFTDLREDYLRRWLEKIAAMGYTGLLWEVEDKVRWETCPECVWPEAMSKREFRAVLDYSRSLGLEPIPLLQTVGHGEYVLLHERYHALREKPDRQDCYCTSNPAVRSFLKTWIEEYLELFGPVRQFHLGGDEAYVFATCPTCAARAQRDGRNALYAEHIADLAGPILAAGARPGIWGDMILHHKDPPSALPREIVIWDWNYGDPNGRPPGTTLDELFPTTDRLRKMGYDVVLCSASRNAGDSMFCPRPLFHVRNIHAAACKSARAGCLAHCVTSWAIRRHPYELQDPLLRLAPAARRRPGASCDELYRDETDRLFGADTAIFRAACEKIGAASYALGPAGSTAIQWNGMKDSLPAPAGHLERRIAVWKTHEQGTLWANWKAVTPKAIASIMEGKAELETVVASNPAARDVLEAWRTAADHQLWRARISALVQELADDPGRSGARDELRRLLAESKSAYRQWLAQQETPLSVAKNTGLIFDPLEEWVGAAGGA